MNPALLLALFGRKPELKTETFNSNTTWTAPAGVTMLVQLVGEGTDGTPVTYSPSTVTTLFVSRSATNPAGGAVNDRSDVYSSAAYATEQFRGTGIRTVSYDHQAWTVGPDNLSKASYSTRSVEVSGDRISSSFGGSSGNITYDNAPDTYIRVSINTKKAATNGTAATAFGKTFPGGVGGPAVPATFVNQPVTPLQQYSIVVPAGATVQISYYV